MAKKQYDPNKKHYFTKMSPKQTETLLRRICNEKYLIQIWPEGGNENKLEEYFFDIFDEIEKRLYLKSKGLLKKFSKSKLNGKKIFAKFSNGNDHYFTHTSLDLNEDNGLYWIPTDLTIYETIQRKDYRLDAGPHVKIKLKVSENVVLDCFDISAGGSSFQVDAEDREFYLKGKEFTKCILRLNKEIFEIPIVKVMSIKEVEKKEEIKIGIAFLNIDRKLDEKLCKTINLEAKSVEIRKIMLEKDKK